jgi:hypothetical protein
MCLVKQIHVSATFVGPLQMIPRHLQQSPHYLDAFQIVFS